jgi:hypothetical protein
VPSYAYRVKVLINLYLWYILNEGWEFRVQCMICICMIDPLNVGVAVRIRQLIKKNSLNC